MLHVPLESTACPQESESGSDPTKISCRTYKGLRFRVINTDFNGADVVLMTGSQDQRIAGCKCCVFLVALRIRVVFAAFFVHGAAQHPHQAVVLVVVCVESVLGENVILVHRISAAWTLQRTTPERQLLSSFRLTFCSHGNALAAATEQALLQMAHRTQEPALRSHAGPSKAQIWLTFLKMNSPGSNERPRCLSPA
jgi:hypothetical protein